MAENGAARTRIATLPKAAGDDRLPPPGTVITRPYRGETVEVTVLENGFEYEGEVYRSLSAAAKTITEANVQNSRCSIEALPRINH